MMNAKLALVFGALSATVILGAGVGISAQGTDDESGTLLSSSVWSQITSIAEVCYANGLDSEQIIDVISTNLEDSLYDDLQSRGMHDGQIQEVLHLIGSIIVQKLEIDESLIELKAEGLHPHEIHELVHPMTLCYDDMVNQLSDAAVRYGFDSGIP